MMFPIANVLPGCDGKIRRGALLVAIMATSTATAADNLVGIIPFAKVREALPDNGRDGVPFAVLGGKENQNEWVEIALGKRLKVGKSDRVPQKETSFGVGLVPRDGYIDVKLGWRAKKRGFLWPEGDGTATARLSLALINGNWDVQVETIEVRWNNDLPFAAPIVNNFLEGECRRLIPSHLVEVLKKKTKELFGSTRLETYSASLVGDKFVVRQVALNPLFDIGKVVDRRALDGRRMVLPACNVDKLRVAIVDRADLDASKAIAFSSMIVDDKIDGQSTAKFNTAPGATAVVQGRIDGQSTVEIVAPGGQIDFHDRIDGQSTLRVDAPNGHVEVFGRVDGQSTLVITAKTVVFHERIDGGNRPKRKTMVVLNLPSDGSATCPEYNAEIIVNFPAGNVPRVEFKNRNREGKLTMIPFVPNK
jgi:hypothetical protein